jgi:hypothetical protein
LEAIEDHKQRCFVETGEKDSDGEPLYRMATVTETLIFATMAVQMGSITEANADEFYARLKFIEALDGPFMYQSKDGERSDRYFTPEDIQAHIGLVCNVSTTTTAAFFGHLRREHFKSMKGHYQREIKLRKSVAA